VGRGGARRHVDVGDGDAQGVELERELTCVLSPSVSDGVLGLGLVAPLSTQV
jgi:hypothetical protein